MALLARARELEAAGRNIVHMEIGEPDFPTPRPVREAVARVLADGALRYTPACGLPALREAIARHYAERFGARVEPEQVVVTPGASGALLLVLGVLVERDAEVLMTDPGYPCNRHFARFIEARARSVPVDEATGFQMDTALLEAHWGPATAAALVASPANPTGTLIAPGELESMAAAARDRGGWLVVDEIYQHLVYGREPASVLSRTSEVFVINSFSKYFSMTGWRVGWLVAPREYVPALDRLAQNLFLAAPTPSQHGAVAALGAPCAGILEAQRAEFAARRDFLVPALRELGFGIPVTPEGAFYVYADSSRFTGDSLAFCRRLLEEAGVAVTPGCDFGRHRAQTHVRFAYTTSMDRLQEGVKRLAAFLEGRRKTP